ncbi:MAG: ATP-binding protein, partial [Muribaculaceae bacterium]|nr:ATP-binding protein [Muribaculaceae bacterium]
IIYQLISLSLHKITSAVETQKYPIGIQTFSSIIEEGYTYVDKTAFIKPLIERGKYYFLSRPRRFGKSLLLSTLHSYFDGRRDLFKGLAIDKEDVDWTPSPVLHFDFNSGVFDQEEGLTTLINHQLTAYEDKYGGQATSKARENIPTRFNDLIEAAYNETGRKVVILVDEYDKPLLGIEENKELFEKNQALLKGFFGNLKSMDRYIRFAFLTGVARFNKVSIFSDLNNLNDISLTEEYADICGWTENELIDNFSPGIEKLAEKKKKRIEETIKELRGYYDGYRFTYEGSRLYNPFSVLNALFHLRIRPYWFATGTPTFLVKRIKDNRMLLSSLNKQWCRESELLEVGFNSPNPVPLLFQTGYLTIRDYDDETGRYELGFPNYEVEHGFNNQLLKLYLPESEMPDSPFRMELFQMDLVEGRPDDFLNRLATLLKDLPYESHNEKTYQNLVYLLCRLSGTEAHLENHSYVGRTDLEVHTRRFIYIFEFKYNRSAEEAMQQIHDRDYAGRYALDPRTLYLIGANFSNKAPNRGLSGYEIEKVTE